MAGKLFSLSTERIQGGLVLLMCLFYLVLAPYSKVEESFSMQAIHDFLYLSELSSFPTKFVHFLRQGTGTETLQRSHSNSSSSWDHEFFPGVVHRTFIGSFVIAFLTKPLQLMNLFESKFAYQVISRAWLAIIFSWAYSRFSQAIVTSIDGRASSVSQWVTWLTLSQFHFLFYASRTLPNTFALISVLLVFSAWLTRRWSQMIPLIAFTVLVLRFETILLFGCILLVEVFYTRQLSLLNVLKVGIPSGLVCLALTILFDSYMWGKWLWPEGDGILFNIVHNKSHEWGTQPFYWYFSSVIPRLLLSSAIFAPLPAFYSNKYFFVGIAFVSIYSILPHKELRFIIYVLPLLNLCAASAIVNLLQTFRKLQNEDNQSYEKGNQSDEGETDEPRRYNLRNRKKVEQQQQQGKSAGSVSTKRKTSSWSRRLAQLFIRWSPLSVSSLLVLHLLLNLVLSMFMFYISANNYPGGVALSAVNEAIRGDDASRHNYNKVSVYVSNLAAQSGFTRFLQLDGVYCNKEPKFAADQFESYELVYLVLEPDERQLYLKQCTSSLANQGTCQLAAANSNAAPFECQWQRNVTAFDRIDRQHFWRVNFRTFLDIYRCRKEGDS